MTSFYNSDLARIHDQNFSQLAEAAADFIKTLASPGHKIVLDLGSGSGTFAKTMTDAGFEVTGVDLSPDMVQLARQNAPTAHFICDSIFEFEVHSCDIISLIGEVICYQIDHKNNVQYLTTLFENLFSQLSAGGLLIFDFLTPDVVTDGHLARRIIERENWSMFVTLDKDVNHEMLTRDITLFYKEGNLYRRSQEIHRQRLFDSWSIQQMLQEIGFNVEIIDSYGEEKFRTGHVGMVCRKK